MPITTVKKKRLVPSPMVSKPDEVLSPPKKIWPKFLIMSCGCLTAAPEEGHELWMNCCLHDVEFTAFWENHRLMQVSMGHGFYSLEEVKPLAA